MKQIQVHDDVHKALRRAIAESGRTITEEVDQILRPVLLPAPKKKRKD